MNVWLYRKKQTSPVKRRLQLLVRCIRFLVYISQRVKVVMDEPTVRPERCYFYLDGGLEKPPMPHMTELRL